MDRILIAKLPLSCRLGVTAEERSIPQTVIVDLELSFDVAPAALSDAIEHTVNYSAVCDCAEATALARPYALVESLAQAMANGLLAQFPVDRVRVLARKPSALARRGAAYAAVELVRSRHG